MHFCPQFSRVFRTPYKMCASLWNISLAEWEKQAVEKKKERRSKTNRNETVVGRKWIRSVGMSKWMRRATIRKTKNRIYTGLGRVKAAVMAIDIWIREYIYGLGGYMRKCQSSHTTFSSHHRVYDCCNTKCLHCTAYNVLRGKKVSVSSTVQYLTLKSNSHSRPELIFPSYKMFLCILRWQFVFFSSFYCSALPRLVCVSGNRARAVRSFAFQQQQQKLFPVK